MGDLNGRVGNNDKGKNENVKRKITFIEQEAKNSKFIIQNKVCQAGISEWNGGIPT